MKIVIAGAGETGSCLARMLSVENQDIVLLGDDRARLAGLEAVHNFITFEGNALSVGDLRQCGVENADLFVAVTPSESVNLVACEIAREIGARKSVARIDSPELASGEVCELLRKRGVDRTIYPERLAAEEICRYLEHSWVRDWFGIGAGQLLFTGVRMEAGGSLCGRMLRDVPNTPRRYHVVAICRGSDIIIPGGSDTLMEGDTVYFSVLPEDIDILPALCGRKVRRIGRVMVTGGGRVTENLLELLGDRYNVTVLDTDAERCRHIATRFPKTVVVNAPANDVATLNEEGIGICDMFIALTGSSEANIVSCMVAREHGVACTVARIEELQYIPEAESLRIDKIVNKKLLNAGKILSMLLSAEMATMQFMSTGNAEVATFVAAEGSDVVSRPVNALRLPRGMTIGGLIRDGKGQLVGGDTRVLPGDHVVVFCLSGVLGKAERMFR